MESEKKKNTLISPDGTALVLPNGTALHGDDYLRGHRLTPTGKISHAKTRVYTQRYRKEWEQMPDFKGWLTSVPCEPTRAYCTYCKKNLHAHRLSLLKHTCTMKHQRSALAYQNETSVEQIAGDAKEAKLEVEQEIEDKDKIDEEAEEEDEDLRYVVERLDMVEDEMDDEHHKEEPNHENEEGFEDETEDDTGDDRDEKIHFKKIRLQRKNDGIRDALAEAMVHVNDEYLGENGENMDLDMVVESVDSNEQEMEVVTILPDMHADMNDEENEEVPLEPGEVVDEQSPENPIDDHIKTTIEDYSSEPTSESEMVILRPSSTLTPAYQISATTSSASRSSTSGTSLKNKTVTLTSVGKTLTLAGNKLKPSGKYVLGQLKGKQTFLVADEKSLAGRSKDSSKIASPKTSQLSGPSVTTVDTGRQSSRKFLLKAMKSPPTKKPCISTHVLDTSRGVPVGGLQVSLYKLMDGRWTFLNESITTPNGRCNDLVDSGKSNFTAGRYKIHFDVDKYFTLRRIETMYPFIEIVFDVKNPTGNYHIPLSLGPFGYSTCRG